MQDTIEREIIIKAPKAQVYAAIADPKQIIAWFPDTIEGGLNEGDQPIFDFGGHGKTQIYVETARPDDYFAYRWVPGANNYVGNVREVPNTLVEFRIVEADGTSTLTLTESGFVKLPKEVAEESLKQNTGGWALMLGRLEKHLTQS